MLLQKCKAVFHELHRSDLIVMQRSKNTLRPQFERGKFRFYVNASYVELLRAEDTTRISGMERVRLAHRHLAAAAPPPAAAAAAASAGAASSSSGADEEELDPEKLEPSFYDLMYGCFISVLF
jgi:hypothetical protein